MLVYNYDPITGVYVGSVTLDDTSELVPTCQTTVAPPAFDDTAQYNVTHQTWSIVKTPVVTPTAEKQAITALAQQSADQQSHIDSLEQAITALAQGGSK